MEATLPLSHWIGFHLFVVALLAIELLYARRSRPPASEAKTHKTSIVATILWITAALGFAGFIFYSLGSASAVQYLAGYAIEEALSVDNLFVFLLLFRLFQIVPRYQPKVLFWGVLGAIVLRGAFIVAGIGLLDHFEWITYVFGAILLFGAIRLLKPSADSEHQTTPAWLTWVSRLRPISLRQDAFFVIEDGRRLATILFLALIAIEITDVVFALDSIPAVLSITRHPFLAYTSNIMAVMGLRSLYFILAHLLEKLRFLHYGLAIILAFAALKMLGSHWIAIGPLTSLAVILAVLAITIGLSLAARKPAAQA